MAHQSTAMADPLAAANVAAAPMVAHPKAILVQHEGHHVLIATMVLPVKATPDQPEVERVPIAMTVLPAAAIPDQPEVERDPIVATVLPTVEIPARLEVELARIETTDLQPMPAVAAQVGIANSAANKSHLTVDDEVADNVQKMTDRVQPDSAQLAFRFEETSCMAATP